MLRFDGPETFGVAASSQRWKKEFTHCILYHLNTSISAPIVIDIHIKVVLVTDPTFVDDLDVLIQTALRDAMASFKGGRDISVSVIFPVNINLSLSRDIFRIILALVLYFLFTLFCLLRAFFFLVVVSISLFIVI
jgi:hypothetical protein